MNGFCFMGARLVIDEPTQQGASKGLCKYFKTNKMDALPPIVDNLVTIMDFQQWRGVVGSVGWEFHEAYVRAMFQKRLPDGAKEATRFKLARPRKS